MREPHFWSADLDPRSREAAPLSRFLLTPFAMLYGWTTARRLKTTTPTNVDIPVICVGNLTAGGVGKSPIVGQIRKHLTEVADLRAATLSRGYKGRLKGPLKVTPAHSAQDVGDEPLMLAASGESWIGADRAAAGTAMAEDGVEAIIMDDGHQNPRLHKDLSFVVIDAKARFGNGHIIPKGPLRETIEAGLARADAVIVVGSNDKPVELSKFTRPILHAHIQPTGSLAAHPYVAFAGIGRPEKMFDSLKAAGADLCDAVPYPDHHEYSHSDIKYLKKLAADHGAKLITTEKDYARLSLSDREGILTFPVEVRFTQPEILHSLLATALKDNLK
ncbi:MAG: tetraacyldisaccharide 4'-kinase [Henriciella sp.]|nr:tetraacyldisaccharide 4'-kinase [Henriciella sp.]